MLSSLPELQYQIALTMAPAIGPITARKLIKKAGSASAVFQMSRSSLERIHGIGPQMSGALFSSSLLERAASEMEFLDRYKITALFLGDAEYPRRLKECADAPILLYVRGKTGLDAKRVLSVVGTRRASSYGKELCRNMVLELAAVLEDLVIISGLAYGIDVIAHRAALDAGIPTLAVLGHGLGTIYPHAHRETAKRIIGQGALLTDFHSGMGPERNNFLRRNRIIAGLADATLVVESASEGGALITAGLASSYDRDVLAVPGRVSDERSRGCNRLIKNQIAALVESSGDVIRALNWGDQDTLRDMSVVEKLELTSLEKEIMELISRHRSLRPEELSEYTGLPIHDILASLTSLEIKACISQEPGNRFQNLLEWP